MTKAKDLRVQSTEELEALLKDRKAMIFEARNAVASKSNEAKPSIVRAHKKDIARTLTILTERTNASSKGA